MIDLELPDDSGTEHMAHLNLDLDYFEHRKTRRLVGLLGRGADVLPIKLWRYVGKYHSEDGRLTGYTEQEIAAAAEWWGKPDEFIAAMLAVVFLEKDGDTYIVHDWLKQQGHIAALRRRNQLNAESRWAKISNATGMRDECEAGATGIRGQCPKPSIPTKPSKPSGDPPGFVAFWSAWPDHFRKKDRRGCLSHWNANELEAKAQAIIAAVEAWKLSEDWTKDDSKYIPGPKPWLNQRVYEAAHPPPARSHRTPQILSGAVKYAE